MKLVEFYTKVDSSVAFAKIIFNYLKVKYPCKRISDFAKTTSGGTPRREVTSYYGGDIPWIKSGELNDGLITEYEESITQEALDNSSAKLYPKGTLVLALYGATVGKVGILDFESASNQAVCAIYPNAEVDKKYLFWFLRQQRLDFINSSFGGAQPNISQTVVKKTEVSVPSIEVQKSIASMLDTFENNKKFEGSRILKEIQKNLEKYSVSKNIYDQVITNNHNNQSYITKLRQAILSDVVQGKLVSQDPNDEPTAVLLEKIRAEKEKLIKEKKIRKEKPLPSISEDEIPYDLPNGWEWVRLGEIIRISSGDGLTSAQMNKEGNVPVFGGNGINGYHNKFNVNKPTLVIGRVGFYCGSIHLTPNVAWVTDNAFITNFSESNIDINYLYWLLRGTNLKEEDNATAQPVISGRKVYPIIVGLSPLNEQKRIAAKIDQLMQLCDRLESQVKENQKNSEVFMEAVLREAFEVNKTC